MLFVSLWEVITLLLNFYFNMQITAENIVLLFIAACSLVPESILTSTAWQEHCEGIVIDIVKSAVSEEIEPGVNAISLLHLLCLISPKLPWVHRGLVVTMPGFQA